MSTADPKPEIRPWPAVSTEDAGDFKIFRVHRTTRRSPTTGREHTFVAIESGDWVNVVALTTEGRLLLVEQYRHGTDAVTLEIPGGAVDPGEDPATAAARELEEETGYRAGRIELIGSVEPNPAFLNNICWTYLATGCTPDGRAQPDTTEEIRVRMSTLEEFTALIDGGVIRHSLVVAAHDHLRRVVATVDETAS